MIPQERLSGALAALNWILVHARTLAREQAPHARLERMFDTAEVLPMLILEPTDRTDAFRAHLEDLVERDPALRPALDGFDQGYPPRA